MPDRSLSGPDPLAIVATARSWIGTPWRHQGRLKGVGCDCLGMIVGVARELGYAVADRTDYAREPDGRELLDGLDLHLAQVAEPAPGDVVLFEIRGRPQHVGLISDRPDGGLGLIHAFAGARKVIEQDFAPGWPGPVAGFWRFPEAEG